LLHLFADSALQILHLLKILLYLLMLHFQTSSRRFTVFQQVLFELELLLHVVDLGLCW
jgi:hypothetical protein